jgi:DNA repair exonuclease SbcCD ATPase subunit
VALPVTISNSQREEVIRRRILCQPFKKIELELGISHGSAFNIEKEWKDALGETDASAVLHLARVLNKQRVTPAQCAEGAKIFAILNELGADPETLEQFLSDLSSRVVAKEMAPNVVATTLIQMSNLSQEFEVPLDQVPETLRNAHTALDEISAHIAESSSKLKLLEQDLQSALDEVQTTRENMSLFLEVEEKLKALGLSLGKIDEITNVINNVEELDGDPVKLVATLATLGSLQEQREALEADIEAKEEKARSLEEKITAVSTELATLSDRQALLNEFEAAGFTLEMQQELLAIIKGVAGRQFIPFRLASAAFMTEVKAGYEPIRGFKAVLENLQTSIRIAQVFLKQEQTRYVTFTDSVKAVDFLQGQGIGEKDLLYWQKVFRDHPQLTKEMLTASLREYADLSEEIIAKQDLLKKLDFDINRLKLASESLSKENIRVAAELAQAKETAADEERRFREKLEQLSKQERQLLFEVSRDVVRQATQNALLEGISLRAANSHLLPIILWENNGPIPQLKDVFIAAEFVLGILKRLLDASDPLTGDLGNFTAALDRRIYGGIESTASSNGGNGGSNSHVKNSVGGEAKK